MPQRQISSRYSQDRPFRIGGPDAAGDAEQVRTTARYAGLPAGHDVWVAGDVQSAVDAGMIERVERAEGDPAPIDRDAAPSARASRKPEPEPVPVPPRKAAAAKKAAAKKAAAKKAAAKPAAKPRKAAAKKAAAK